MPPHPSGEVSAVEVAATRVRDENAHMKLIAVEQVSNHEEGVSLFRTFGPDYLSLTSFGGSEGPSFLHHSILTLGVAPGTLLHVCCSVCVHFSINDRRSRWEQDERLKRLSARIQKTEGEVQLQTRKAAG